MIWLTAAGSELMEYFRQESSKIPAGFALNAGKLLLQYSAFSESLIPQERYDATLTICILQSLLTNCWELIESMKNHQKQKWLETVTDVPGLFEIRRIYVKENTFSSDPNKLTYEEFVGHLRNALSHPTYPEKIPSTGYTTVPDKTGTVSQFRFIDSPWVKRGVILSGACAGKEGKVRQTADSFSNKHQCGKLEVRQNSEGIYQIFREHENARYLPIFEAVLPLESLGELARKLANYLAQPTQENWDGTSIARVVA
jgi:hypothetical protein